MPTAKTRRTARHCTGEEVQLYPSGKAGRVAGSVAALELLCLPEKDRDVRPVMRGFAERVILRARDEALENRTFVGSSAGVLE